MDEAQQRLKQAGLSKFETSFKFDPSKRDPIVLDQSPAAGSAAEAETTVSVVLSFPGIAVPDLRGKSLLAAAQTLSNNNLALGEAKSQPTDAKPEQTVIDQNPAPGQAVDKGTPITLTVATKPTNPIIPWNPKLFELMTKQKQIFKVMPRGIEPAEQ
ncbi:PASTA domain-containing protein [Methylomonas koyamae]|uniref:PASTA domain-containing protein n=1 Tax=Methylomonas koyamae TaxID=702114 RepID=UPI0006D1A737|nr:PASTA domain-containing protein [Methylomonas koyamae]